MKLSKDTISAQHALADYCRTGEDTTIAGVRPERVHHYRRLVKNVIHNTLEQAYPITHELLDKQEWDMLVNEFFINHTPQSPQVWKLPKEFYEFLRDNNYPERLNRPYFNDLLHFEWIEIEVHTMPDGDIPDYLASGNVLKDRLVFNPDFRIIYLEYPVHLMSVEQAKQKKGNYYLLVYRESDSGNVKFLNISLLLAYIIEQIHTGNKTLTEVLPNVQSSFKITNMEEAQRKLQQFMEIMYKQKFLLGFDPA